MKITVSVQGLRRLDPASRIDRIARARARAVRMGAPASRPADKALASAGSRPSSPPSNFNRSDEEV